MDTYETFASLALAAAAGLLVGLERERSRPEDPARAAFLGGARTHPLLALVGGVAALAAREVGVAAIVLPFAALVLLLVVNYADEVRRDRNRGITSETAFLLSFSLGVLSLTEHVLLPLAHKAIVVSAVAVGATLLLSSKPTLHPLVRRVSVEDVAATLRFLIVAVIVVPLLPDRQVGPLDALNPFQIGLLVVFISGISFAGYAAIRLLGARAGLGLTGLVGGLVSSTAVTLSMAGRAREQRALTDAAALAVMLASTVMFVRVLVVVSVVNPSLAGAIAPPMVGGALGGAAASAALWWRARTTPPGAGVVAFSNPFELGSALRFALLFGAVLVGSKAAALYLGTAGTYGAGVVAGSTDVDAITLSMAKLAGGAVSHRVAATTIFLGAASNTVVKGVMAAIAGGGLFGRRVLAGQGLALAAGALGVAIAWMG
jgi:uncharacterized membrane protein (DUF4010 family)